MIVFALHGSQNRAVQCNADADKVSARICSPLLLIRIFVYISSGSTYTLSPTIMMRALESLEQTLDWINI